MNSGNAGLLGRIATGERRRPVEPGSGARVLPPQKFDIAQFAAGSRGQGGRYVIPDCQRLMEGGRAFLVAAVGGVNQGTSSAAARPAGGRTVGVAVEVCKAADNAGPGCTPSSRANSVLHAAAGLRPRRRPPRIGIAPATPDDFHREDSGSPSAPPDRSRRRPPQLPASPVQPPAGPLRKWRANAAAASAAIPRKKDLPRN